MDNENQNLAVKKSGGKRMRKPPPDTLWRSKRLKENDEKLASSTFYCKECKKSYRNEEIYTAHMLDHENIDNVVSRIDKFNRVKVQLSQELFEIKFTNKRKEYKCRLCAHLFLDMRDAKSHQRIHDGTNPWYCSLCNKHFLRSEHYTRHIEVHGDSKDFQCSTCNKCFTTLDLFSKHRMNHCLNLRNEIFNCHLCDQSFVDKTSLDAHVAIHKMNSFLHCELCEKDFMQRDLYDAHMKQHDDKALLSQQAPENHEILFTQEKSDNNRKSCEYDIYKCHKCAEKYNLLEDLEMHYEMSESCLEIVCTECQVEFQNVGELCKHLETSIVISTTSVAATDELNEKIFVCRFCKRGFHVLPSFSEHMKIHCSEKPIKCPKCKENFDSEDKLRIHTKLVHKSVSTALTKYPCVECGFMFSDSAQLKKHVKCVHISEKTFRCLPCSRTFQERAELEKHFLTKPHEKKAFQCGYIMNAPIEKVDKQLHCGICEKIFMNVRELKKHQYVHQRIQTKLPTENTFTGEQNKQHQQKPQPQPVAKPVVDQLPVYFNEAIYNFVDGEQVVLTTEEQTSYFNTRINIDDAGNIGLVFVDKKKDDAENSLVTHCSVGTQSLDFDVTEENGVGGDQTVHQQTSIEECSEETFLALSEMVKEGKIDLSSLEVISRTK